MSAQAILPPFFLVQILTLVVWIYMYAKRIPFLRGLDLEPDEITPAELARRSPPSVSNPSDNLKNLFELPPLFYAVVLLLYLREAVAPIDVVAAWIFAVFRVLHSAVHCTVNIVLLRFALYCVSALGLWVLVVRGAIGLALG